VSIPTPQDPTHPTPQAQPAPQPLARFSPGDRVIVQAVDLDADNAVRLNRMGLCVGRTVEVIQPGDPTIVCAVGSRLAISRQLAGKVTAAPCPACDTHALTDPDTHASAPNA
jgi:Fe2+ transport system protein FeoA